MKMTANPKPTSKRRKLSIICVMSPRISIVYPGGKLSFWKARASISIAKSMLGILPIR